MRSLPAGLTLVTAAAWLVAGCGSAETPSPVDAPTPSAAPIASAPASSGGVLPSRSPAASPAASVRPSTSPTRSPAGSPAASGAIDATACTGSDANRKFFADTAAAVAWDVYCPVLPNGWFVDSGSFRAASGGYMTIGYKTSGSLRFELKEGTICSGSPTDCAPVDTALSTASFADRVGQLGMKSGSLVLYVSPGVAPSYQATGTGLDEATFRAFAAALARVPG